MIKILQPFLEDGRHRHRAVAKEGAAA
jgi:hypothetical protein